MLNSHLNSPFLKLILNTFFLPGLQISMIHSNHIIFTLIQPSVKNPNKTFKFTSQKIGQLANMYISNKITSKNVIFQRISYQNRRSPLTYPSLIVCSPSCRWCRCCVRKRCSSACSHVEQTVRERRSTPACRSLSTTPSPTLWLCCTLMSSSWSSTQR